MQLHERAMAAAVDGEAVRAAASLHAAAAVACMQQAEGSHSDDDDTLEPEKTVTRVCSPRQPSETFYSLLLDSPAVILAGLALLVHYQQSL